MKKYYLPVIFLCVMLFSGCAKKEFLEHVPEQLTETQFPDASSGIILQNFEQNKTDADPANLEINLHQISAYIRCYKKPEQRDLSITQLSNIIHDYGYEMRIEEFDIYTLDLDTLGEIWNVNKARDLNPMNSDKLGIGKNLIAEHPNNKKENKTLFLTAHYDTTAGTVGVIDNGTGVSVVLELMDKLSNYKGSLNLVFVLFDCEEIGQQGSRSFIRNRYPMNDEEVLGCINVDMVGEIDGGDIVMRFGNGEHNIISLMWEHQTGREADIWPGTLTDELVFNYSKVPAITLANKTPDFSLDKASPEEQLKQIDFSQIAGLTNDILKFINNFDFDYYKYLIKERPFVDSVLSSSNILKIEGLDYLSKKASLIDNGYICETVFYYRMKTGREISISLIPGGHFDSDHIDNYDIYNFPVEEYDKYHNGIIETGQLLYKKIAVEDKSFDIEYYNGVYTGYIRGLDETIVNEILEVFQKSVINNSYYEF